MKNSSTERSKSCIYFKTFLDICNFSAPNFGFCIGTFWVFYILFAEIFCIRKLTYSETLTKQISNVHLLILDVFGDFSFSNFQDNISSSTTIFDKELRKRFFCRS